MYYKASFCRRKDVYTHREHPYRVLNLDLWPNMIALSLSFTKHCELCVCISLCLCFVSYRLCTLWGLLLKKVRQSLVMTLHSTLPPSQALFWEWDTAYAHIQLYTLRNKPRLSVSSLIDLVSWKLRVFLELHSIPEVCVNAFSIITTHRAVPSTGRGPVRGSRSRPPSDILCSCVGGSPQSICDRIPGEGFCSLHGQLAFRLHFILMVHFRQSINYK